MPTEGQPDPSKRADRPRTPWIVELGLAMLGGVVMMLIAPVVVVAGLLALGVVQGASMVLVLVTLPIGIALILRDKLKK